MDAVNGRANDEIDKVRKAQDSEVARLQAALKRAEVKVKSMEQTIEQRVSHHCQSLTWLQRSFALRHSPIVYSQ